MSTMKQDLRRLGYTVISLPKRMNFDTLSRFVNMFKLPLLLDLDLSDTQFLHVIALIPIFCEEESNIYQKDTIIIEGSVSHMRPIEFSKKT